MKIALSASIVLNLFVLGAAAGAYFWQGMPQPSRQSGQGITAAAEALEPAEQQAFRQALARARRNAQSDSQAARDARDTLARLLNEPELDRKTIDAALEAARNADIKVRERVEAAVVDFAESLDPASRAILIKGLSRRGQILPRAPATRDTKK